MTREPVTISGQTFIYDESKGGWIDKKTKQPADKALLKILNFVSEEQEAPLQKVRSKIDKSVEPITIAGEKYVFDANKGWLDAKSKQLAPKHLQTLLNDVSKKEKDEVKKDIPVENVGVAAKAAREKVKIPQSHNDNPTLKYNSIVHGKDSVNKIKPMIAAMVQHLIVINDLLKQRLKNQGILEQAEVLANRENGIEATSPDAISDTIIQEDKSSVSPLLVAGAIGLFAMAFDPIRDAIKETYGVVKDLAVGFGDVLTSFNDKMIWFLSKTGGDPVKDQPKQTGSNTKKAETGVGSPVTKSDRNAGHQNYNPQAPALSLPSKSSGTTRIPTPPLITKSDISNKATPSSNIANGSGPVKSANPATSNAAAFKGPTKNSPTFNPGTKNTSKPNVTNSSGFIDPVNGKVGSGYGMRFHPIHKKNKMHKGLDYPLPAGTNVMSVAEGTVQSAGWNSGGFGNFVVIKHANGVVTRYAHLSKILTRAGDTVKQGQVIGHVGTTGSSTGNHLHFEVMKNGVHQDPTNYVKGIKGKSIPASMSAGYSGEGHDHGKEGGSLVSKIGGITGDTLTTVAEGFSKIATFETEYKPWEKNVNEKSHSVNKAAAEKHAAITESKNPKPMPVIVKADRPNLNKNGGTVRTPVSAGDDKISMQYLDYFDLVD